MLGGGPYYKGYDAGCKGTTGKSRTRCDDRMTIPRKLTLQW